MRAHLGAMALCVTLAACSSSDGARPVVTAIRHGNVSVSPLPICTGPGKLVLGSNSIAAITVEGSNFLPEANLVSDDAGPVYPTVVLRGPGGRLAAPTTYLSSTELTAGVPDIDFGTQQPTPYGAYDLIVVDPDGNDALVPHAIDHIPPPQPTGVQPAAVCRDRNETVVVSGVNITPGAPRVTVNGSTLPGATAATATTVMATIPAGFIPLNSTSALIGVEDIAGCSFVTTVNVFQGCGP